MKKDEKPAPAPVLLAGVERAVVQTLMPISIMWDDFLAKHEYIDNQTAMQVNVEQLMKLVTDTNNYIHNVYKEIGVTQQQWDEIANKVVMMMYPDVPPHPDKNGDNPPEAAGVRK